MERLSAARPVRSIGLRWCSTSDVEDMIAEADASGEDYSTTETTVE
jgi:hypothetical protein